MTEIVVSDRVVPRLLAVVPAVVVTLAVRVMTLGAPPAVVRVGAACAIALACWTAYRMLTVKVTIGDTSVLVRGVFYDAEIGYDDLSAVDHAKPHLVVRALIWGTMTARAVSLKTTGRTMRPLALLSFAEDMDIDRAVDAMLVRTGAYRVPSQRRSTEDATRVR